MRFIVEFIEPEYFIKNRRFPYIPEKRHIMEAGMGSMIAESLGWQNPVNHNLEHHRLEIEAFPAHQWETFKQKLFNYLLESGPMVSGAHVSKLIKELESYSNQVKPNQNG